MSSVKSQNKCQCRRSCRMSVIWFLSYVAMNRSQNPFTQTLVEQKVILLHHVYGITGSEEGQKFVGGGIAPVLSPSSNKGNCLL